ncbi:spore gernimation protein [Rummeliibacillus stabekisii]|uniref:Spore gernimation protein n=2 Tax=Rummeliibacillus stabekisii TaxID=241244 RepID=A0A143HCD2_9BACL|nr:endospore germination permease [Rummeliibacillus stabekisii]AMW99384.1 spore gernimation protein [Rummeliibacillus stabekisii]
MRNEGSISILHVVFLTMTFIGLKNHVTIIPSILQTAGRDGWASVLLGALGIFIWVFLLVYVHNNSNQEPIKDWLKQRIGKVSTAIVLYGTAFYLLLLAAFTMRETLLWVSTTFLHNTPFIILLIIFILLVMFLAASGLQTIVIVNVFVLTGVVILGFFVAFVNLQVKDYGLLRPFFEHGFQPVLMGTIYPSSGFVELLMLLFIQHKIQKRMRWYHFALILVILTGLTIGPLVGAITEFGPTEAAKQRYPAYEEWGLARIGRFIEHIDFFSIYQWLTGTFLRVGFILFVCADILNISSDKKQVWSLLAPPFLFICLSLTLFRENVFIAINERYFLISTFFFFIILSLFLTIVALTSRKSVTKDKDKNDQKSGEEQSNQVKTTQNTTQ